MIYQSIDKGEALWLTMSREAPSPTNDYADDDREWITEEVQIDELVMDAYMAYQARIWEGCKDIRGSREYNYNKTEAEVQEAWNAGYEMAARQYYGKYGGGPVRKETGIWPTHIAIGMRNSYGIRYPHAFITCKSFEAGYWRFHATHEPTLDYQTPMVPIL